VSGDTLVKRSLLRTRRWPLDDVGSVARVTISSPTTREPLEYALILRRDGRCLARMETSWWWSRTDVDRLASALGRPVVDGERLTATQAHARYPGSAAWWMRHPWGFALPTTGAILVVICILIAVLGAKSK
jgi:hypothetical protein